MFQKIDADIFVLVDGDDTYPAGQVQSLINPVLNDEADMTVGSRIAMEAKVSFILLTGLGIYSFNTWLTLFSVRALQIS